MSPQTCGLMQTSGCIHQTLGPTCAHGSHHCGAPTSKKVYKSKAFGAVTGPAIAFCFLWSYLAEYRKSPLRAAHVTGLEWPSKVQMCSPVARSHLRSVLSSEAVNSDLSRVLTTRMTSRWPANTHGSKLELAPLRTHRKDMVCVVSGCSLLLMLLVLHPPSPSQAYTPEIKQCCAATITS